MSVEIGSKIAGKASVEFVVERGIPCERHTPLGEGCVDGCRRCLTVAMVKRQGVRGALHRWYAGYWRPPILVREVQTVDAQRVA